MSSWCRASVDEPLHLGVVLGDVGFQLRFAAGGAPGAAEVVHLGREVGAEHDLEVEPVAPDHLEHALGVQAAVVQAQQPPVLLQDAQVLADLGHRRIDLLGRALAAPVAGVADGVAALAA